MRRLFRRFSRLSQSLAPLRYRVSKGSPAGRSPRIELFFEVKIPDHISIPPSILPGGHRRPSRCTWFRTPSCAGIGPLKALRFHFTSSPHFVQQHTQHVPRFLSASSRKIGNYMCVHLAPAASDGNPKNPKRCTNHREEETSRKPNKLKPNR